MPGRKLFLLALPLAALTALVRLFGRRWSGDAWEYGGTMAEPATEPVPTPRPRPRPAARLTVAAALTAVFFAGASFTAVAGDRAATLLEDDEATEAPVAEPAEEAAPATEDEAEAEDVVAAEDPQAASPAAEPAPEAPEAVLPVPQAEAAPAANPAVAEEASAAGDEAAPAAAADPALAHELQADPLTDLPAAAAPVAAPAGASGSSAAPQAARRKAPQPTPAGDDAAATPEQRSRVSTRAAAAPSRKPEVDHGDGLGEPTVWLNRALPDPTPGTKRLTARFAEELRSAARRHGADWAAILGVLRAQGSSGSTPATVAELDVLARRLAGREPWRAALALSGRTELADRADALRDYYAAVGPKALVEGLTASKERLVKRLLEDERVWIYWGGQSDLALDRIDVRIVVLIAYLAERHESVTVSSLSSGHRTYSRPGVISAHTYGQAVDIAAVGGTSMLGNSEPGGKAEEAVRSILLLPAELQPQQVISLLGLGGPSFPLASHDDHIHVGY